MAVVLLGAGDLSGGGGAERFFAELVRVFETRPSPVLEVALIVDEATVEALGAVGIDLPERHCLRISSPVRLASLVQPGEVLGLVDEHGIELLHVAQALPRHLPWLYRLSLRRRARRPAVTLNVNDYRLRERHDHPVPLLERLGYAPFLAAPALCGVFVWYERLATWLRERTRWRKLPVVAARYCFVDAERYVPAPDKDRLVVCAGRLVDHKRPLLFIDAVAAARERDPETVAGWRFAIFGKGPLDHAIEERIERLGLTGTLVRGDSQALRETLAESTIFVSPQDTENFTSLAMLEAMACGNAIVARDVGQTKRFVRPGENGELAADDTAESLATALLAVMRADAGPGALGLRSRRLVESEFNAANVCGEFEAFWTLMLDVGVERR